MPQVTLSTFRQPWTAAGNAPIVNDSVPPANINIGTIETTDEFAEYLELDPAEGWSFFVDYIINNSYESDKHIYMMPVAFGGSLSTVTKGPSAAFVQLANPTLLWIADWTACKTGNQPEIPDSLIRPNVRWVLLDESMELHNVGFGADGRTPIYRISGTYVYGCVNPDQKLINDVNFGRPPWLDDSVIERDMPVTKLQQNITIDQDAD
jgi:hypothetical protein